ncbi:integrase family protein [Aureimonas sp. AU40]|uniref:integrase family protein n=1 Tax=Aureimonas sp. AU40 TaxID=1637747 RepID=UPI0007828F2A|nr:integrase family protein [Aureimonas sp. AU40]
MPQEITEDDVDRSLIPTRTRWQVADTVAPGLVLRAGATPSWHLRITKKGILKLAIGGPPSMSLDVARRIAREGLADHLSGKKVDAAWVAKAQKRHDVREVVEAAPRYVEPPGPWRWEDAVEAWLHYLTEKGRSPVTVDSYRKCLLSTLSGMRGRLVRDVTAAEAQAALDEVAATYPALAAQVLKAVRPFSQWISIGYRTEKSGVREHRYRRLTLPEPETRRPRGWQPVSLSAVARLVAIARLGVLSPPVSRALEVIVWTALPRSAVVPTRHEDVVDGVWTVRGDLLKRKQSIRLPLHDRLRELLSGGDDVWVFEQPRRPRKGLPSHLPVEGLSRATWELPDVPTASEVGLAMRSYLQENGSAPTAVQDLTDSGGDDERRDDEGGQPLWVRRGWLLQDWHEAVEPLVAEQAAGLDADAIRAAMREKRPYKG